MSNPSFGRSASQLTNITELLEFERRSEQAQRFEALDALVGDLLVQSLRGQRIVTLTHQTRDDIQVVLDGLNNQQRALVDATFALTAQQRRGAWFIPDEATVRAGWVNLPYAMQHHERFAAGIAWEEREKINLKSSSDAMMLWALLEPLAELLYLPFALRGPLTGTKAPEEATKLWTQSAAFLDALGLHLTDELAVVRPGKGWSKLRAGEQYAAKQKLMAALARRVTPETASRYRAYRLYALIGQYYKKAKADGKAKRTQVVTKAMERSLSALFGGDWLAFLDYLGEEPHAEEQIVTQLPKSRLYVGTSSRAAEIAAQQGLPVEEVERMLSTFWQQPASASPVEQRVAVLRRYWESFDAIQARQAVGMTSLWGLVEERFAAASLTDSNAAAPQAFLYRKLLPGELVIEIDGLWSTSMLPRYPEYMVSEPYPHAAMAEAFGPALTFWHGCALTAWFLCEGPYSRTDMAGLAEYHHRHLSAMNDHGTPVNPRLFEELIAAEKRLGPPQPTNQDKTSHTVGSGISISITYSSGNRRAGFDRLRDIITRHRQAWAKEHLDTYLRARWETPLRSASQAYNKLLHDKGKPPTVKQTAKLAEDVTNAWFAGDLHAFYGAIGEKASVQPQRRLRLPQDRERFIHEVFARLGGRQLGPQPDYSDRVRYDAHTKQVQEQWALARLAELSLKYVQMWEVFDRLPTVEEVSASTFEQWKTPLSDTTDIAWQRYSTIIVASVQAAAAPPSQQPKRATQAQPKSNISSAAPASTPVSSETDARMHGVASSQTAPAASKISAPAELPQPEHKRSWLDKLLGRK